MKSFEGFEKNRVLMIFIQIFEISHEKSVLETSIEENFRRNPKIKKNRKRHWISSHNLKQISTDNPIQYANVKEFIFIVER
jgi:hypothetical protein